MTTGRHRQKYTKEFKDNAVKLDLDSGDVQRKHIFFNERFIGPEEKVFND